MRKKGFTMVELIVVLIILSITASLYTGEILGYSEKNSRIVVKECTNS